MSIDDDLKANLHRYAKDSAAEDAAREQADKKTADDRRDFLVEFGAKMRGVVEPALEAAYRELLAAGLETASYRAEAGHLKVILSLNPGTFMAYAPALHSNSIEVLISAKQTDLVQLDLSGLTPLTVRRHVEALLAAARGEPPGLGWGGPG